MIRLSVVIPTYNAGALLAESVTSVGAAERSDVEVIVVDDGSTDDSPESVRALPGVRVVAVSNGGPGQARNHGIELARGELIAFLDADDRWLAGRTDAIIGADIAAETTILYGDYSLERQGREPRTIVITALPERAAPRLLLHNTIATSTVVTRRAHLEVAGGFHPDLRFAEDWDLWLRLAELGPITKLPGTWVTRREVEGSLADADVSYLDHCQHSVVERAISRHPELYAGVAQRARAQIDLRSGMRYYTARRYTEARAPFARALTRGCLRPTWKYLTWSLLSTEPRWWKP